MFEILKFEQRRTSSKSRIWGKSRKFALIKCECGNEKWVNYDHIRSGRTKTCGCGPSAITIIHGMSRTSEYRSWESMLQRCENPKNHKYPIYGARGITVCDRWHDFQSFISDMGLKPAKGLTIERNDTNGNYEPGNCRWATRSEQCRNKRNSRFVTIGGVRKLLIDVAKEMNLKPGVAAYRFGFASRLPKKRSLMHLLDNP